MTVRRKLGALGIDVKAEIRTARDIITFDPRRGEPAQRTRHYINVWG